MKITHLIITGVAAITISTSAMAGNEAIIVQDGIFNSAYADQRGRDNDIVVEQYGFDNYAKVRQSGRNNGAAALQTGEFNTIDLVQRRRSRLRVRSRW